MPEKKKSKMQIQIEQADLSITKKRKKVRLIRKDNNAFDSNVMELVIMTVQRRDDPIDRFEYIDSIQKEGKSKYSESEFAEAKSIVTNPNFSRSYMNTHHN